MLDNFVKICRFHINGLVNNVTTTYGVTNSNNAEVNIRKVILQSVNN
jgi:hypothetical protein